MTDYRKRLEARIAVADRCNDRIPTIDTIGVGIEDLRQLLSEGERMREALEIIATDADAFETDHTPTAGFVAGIAFTARQALGDPDQ